MDPGSFLLFCVYHGVLLKARSTGHKLQQTKQFHSKRDGKRITASIHQFLNYVKEEVLELKRFLTGGGWKFEINVRYLQSPW